MNYEKLGVQYQMLCSYQQQITCYQKVALFESVSYVCNAHLLFFCESKPTILKELGTPTTILATYSKTNQLVIFKQHF